MSKKSLIFFAATVILVSIICLPLMLFQTENDSDVFAPDEKGVIVLCYHRVLPKEWMFNSIYEGIEKITNDSELKIYSVSGDEFERQIEYFKQKNVKIMSMEELELCFYNRMDFPDKGVVITFDDVDISVYKNAFPILEKHKTPFTLFIITGQVGNSDFKGLNLATWQQINEMHDSGLATLGLHTHDYHYLDKQYNPPFLSTVNSYAFYKDACLAKETLQKNTGVCAKYFSYPYGFGTPETDKYLLKSGMKLIFSLAPGVTNNESETFFVKRMLANEESFNKIKMWVEN